MNAARQDAERPRADRPRSILIVDDTTDIRELYALYFRKRGYNVFTAMDGRAGMLSAVQHRPDVIVMDLSMPGIDGIDTTRELKRDARLRHTAVIILTGYPLRAVQGGALEAGAQAFLTKPCLPEELEEHVQRLLDPDRPNR